MTQHRTYRGKAIDMAAFRAKNEKTVALGNMGVNAKGEKVGTNGQVVESSNKRVRQQVGIPTPAKEVSLKSKPEPEEAVLPEETKPKRTQVKKAAAKPQPKKPVEKELDNGDIVIDDE